MRTFIQSMIALSLIGAILSIACDMPAPVPVPAPEPAPIPEPEPTPEPRKVFNEGVVAPPWTTPDNRVNGWIGTIDFPALAAQYGFPAEDEDIARYRQGDVSDTDILAKFARRAE